MMAVLPSLAARLGALAPDPSGAGAGPAALSSSVPLLLLVGGLAMLSLVVVLVILQSLLPDASRHAPRAATPGHRQLRPLTSSQGWPPTPDATLQRRAELAQRGVAMPVLDVALDRAVSMGVGEPRLLGFSPEAARVRLYACPSCAGRPPGPSWDGADWCAAQAVLLGQAFHAVYGRRASATETACCLQGAPACEFEVAW